MAGNVISLVTRGQGFFFDITSIHHWNLSYILIVLYILPAFFTTMAGTRYFSYKAPLEGEQLIGFIAFLAATHLLPPWLHPPYSVWAVPLLPPVTLGNSAKLWLAKPYGLSLTKDMTERLYLLTQ